MSLPSLKKSRNYFYSLTRRRIALVFVVVDNVCAHPFSSLLRLLDFLFFPLAFVVLTDSDSIAPFNTHTHTHTLRKSDISFSFVCIVFVFASKNKINRIVKCR